MPKKLILLSILIASSFTLVALIFINKDKLLTSFRNSKLTIVGRDESPASRDDFNESLELEKLLYPLNETEASASESSKVKYINSQLVSELAKQRVIQRKVLETEGQKLGLDVAQIRKDSQPVRVARNGSQLTATALAALYSYDEDLQKAVKEKVEGYVEKQVLSIVFSSSKLAPVAQGVANDILPLIEKGGFDSQNYLKDHPLDKNLSLFDRIIRDPLKAYTDPTKLPALGQTKLEATPFSYDIVKIVKIEKGLGVSFEDWYRNVEKKYL